METMPDMRSESPKKLMKRKMKRNMSKASMSVGGNLEAKDMKFNNISNLSPNLLAKL